MSEIGDLICLCELHGGGCYVVTTEGTEGHRVRKIQSVS